MKLLNVLIVDDELHIRGGIKLKVDWDALGMKIIGEASDGNEALQEIEKGEIDIVITDINMPIMDGLEMIEKAKEINDRITFIIISGYSDFEYARSAMKLGITEYLLKPVKESEIQASLLKVKEKLAMTTNEEENESKKRNKMREESLLQILSNKHAATTFFDFKKMHGQLHTKSNNVMVGLIKIESFLSSREAVDRKPTHTQYDDIETLFTKQLSKTHSGHIIKCIWPEHEFVLLLQSTQNDDKVVKLKRTLSAILLDLQGKFGIQATIGLSSAGNSQNPIIPYYQEALFALRERILRGTGKVIDFDIIPANLDKPNFKSETETSHPFTEERKWDQVKENINAAIRNSCTKGSVANHNHLYELFIELYLTIKNFAAGNVESVQDMILGNAGWENIANISNSFTNIEQMVEWLYSYALSTNNHLSEGTDGSGREIVQWVQKYIKDFYSSEITLAKVSEKYHINPIYFSRIFKTYVGESFNNYITRIRMEEAKTLMETTSLRVQDISEIVGYEDPKYFSKVFKKYFGKSTSLYSENRGIN